MNGTMKPLCKSFDDIAHNKNNAAYNFFMFCSAISLLIFSAVSLFKFISEHCCQRYEYRYDDVCTCGCHDSQNVHREDQN